MTARNNIDESQFRDVLNAVERGEEGSKEKLVQFVFSECEVNEELIKELQAQVDKGDTEAMWKLGLCKEYGIATKQNREEAQSLYDRSSGDDPFGLILATNGNEGGCVNEDEVEVEEDVEGVGDEEDDEYYEEDECYEEGYDDSYDDYANGVLNRIGCLRAMKTCYNHAGKGTNSLKGTNWY